MCPPGMRLLMDEWTWWALSLNAYVTIVLRVLLRVHTRSVLSAPPLLVFLLASSSSSASSLLLSRTLCSSRLSCCLLPHLSLSETRDRRWRALLIERLNRNSRNKIQFGRSGSESSVSEVHISK